MVRIQKRSGFIFKDLDFLYKSCGPHPYPDSPVTLEKWTGSKMFPVSAFPFTWIPAVASEWCVRIAVMSYSGWKKVGGEKSWNLQISSRPLGG